ncbi:MAG: type II toxin-antitoxin system VapC family toxin [Phenylobacterium sp.]|uniref:type II toxin-antitoxin system VapC family toxin n=1 Tax=Phenylobacterium sp. TaxID=1871053 RepID=UPI0027351E4B|nr:type II toxin-antitoxin system VapC family toxin [Phenylobacterium sp.]MDP3749166.1 type II toxin-antitoxin system VapC family toxin [Phenylobacterium sp.]
MSVLLDTHALLWWLIEPERLSPPARLAIENADEVWVSTVSIYEIDFKRREPRLRNRNGALQRMPHNMPETLPSLGLQLLDITAGDAWEAARLPLHHRDPWDRILVAQARRLEADLITKDEALTAYAVDVLW